MPLALVTGSASRLGRAIALMLAGQGWDIAVHYRHSQAQALQTVLAIEPLGVQAQAFQADLADEKACRALLPRIIENMGPVRAVINNASLFEYDDALTFSGNTLSQHMQTNTVAAVVLAQALHQHHAASDDGTKAVVVNLLDQKLWNLNPDHFSYTLSKAALHTATQMLAVSLAPQVRVVGVAPGLTLPGRGMKAQEFEDLHQLSPLGRSSEPEDIAKAVAFVLDNQAVTGTTILVDGGQHLMPMSRDFSLMNQK